MRNRARVMLLMASALVVLAGCPNLFGPSEEEVEQIIQYVLIAPADLVDLDLLTAVVEGDNLVFSSTDGTYEVVVPMGSFGGIGSVTTFTAYTPPTSEMEISGSYVNTQTDPTEDGFQSSIERTLTIEYGHSGSQRVRHGAYGYPAARLDCQHPRSDRPHVVRAPQGCRSRPVCLRSGISDLPGREKMVIGRDYRTRGGTGSGRRVLPRSAPGRLGEATDRCLRRHRRWCCVPSN
jgi:hypothetical protein